jgi:hypothetical protein
MSEILERAHVALEAMIAKISTWGTAEKDLAGELGKLINDVCVETHFASGASEIERSESDPRSTDVRVRFYQEACELLNRLTRVRLAAGAHEVIQLLESYIDHSPEEVLLRIATTVRESSHSGYQFESLAETLVVNIVQRYLADYRSLLRTNDGCRTALLELLDTFVSAGWPSARELAYGLEEIFR